MGCAADPTLVWRPVAAQTGIAPGRPLRRRTPHLRGPAELDGAGGDVRRRSGFVRELAGNRPFDIAVEGATEPGTAAGHIAPYAAAGATWWVEAMGWWRGGLATARDRITAGPPA